MNIEVNYLAVLVASLASMALGFLWYGPLILGKPWMKERKLSEKHIKASQKAMSKLYALSFVLSLVTAYVLSHVTALSQNFYQYSPVMAGVTSAFWMWLGFMMPVQATATIFSDEKNWKLFAIDTGYQFASMLAMGLVIGLL